MPWPDVGQNHPQPGRQLGVGPSAKLTKLFVRDQQGLLDHVGRVELTA